MTATHVRLNLPATRGGELVEIDGQDVTSAIRHVSVEAGIHDRSVTVQFAMAGVEHDGIQKLYIAAAQVGLLARFGWRPPDGYQMNERGDVLLERLADPKDPRADQPTGGTT